VSALRLGAHAAAPLQTVTAVGRESKAHPAFCIWDDTLTGLNLTTYPEKVNLISCQAETSAKSRFVILSEAKDLVFPCSYEILRSLRSLRMTGKGTFAEVSSRHQKKRRGDFRIAPTPS